jgi:hypothetical protein
MAEKKKKNSVKKFVRGEQIGARRSLLEELFNDFYKDRHNIYIMNFFRGIFFGLGSVIGATVVAAFIVWILSFFVKIPFIGDSVQQAQDQIQSRQNK